MNCLYCNLPMNLTGSTYECFKIEGTFGHVLEMDTNIENNDKEMRFFINRKRYREADAVFFSSENLTYAHSWKNSFHLKDFDVLKTIKTSEQLKLFINKLKIFT